MRPCLAWIGLLCAGLLTAAQADYTSGPFDPSQYVTPQQAAAMAPVQSVNGQTGAVSVPIYARQVSEARPVATGDGTVTWTFPTAFANAPTCFYTLTASTTAYTFDFPQVTAISKTAVSLLVTAHPRSLSIASLALPVLLQLTPVGVPAGTTITFSCLAPV